MSKRFHAGFGIVLTLALIFVSACSTPGKSVGAGAALGGLAGAGVGAIANPGKKGENRFRNVVVGTAVGAAVGAGAGYLADRYVQNERDEAEAKGRAEANKENAGPPASAAFGSPQLVPAKTEARWVPDQIRGSIFVPGHFEYVIIEGARWETER